MKPIRNIGRAVAAATILALGACGSSTHSPRTSTPTSAAATITKAEWLAKAQQLCDKYNSEIGAVAGGGHDPATRNAASMAIINLIRQHVADARALGYPPGDRAILEPVFIDMDRALAQLQSTGPHPNVQQAIGQAVGADIAKLQAYGSC